MQKQSHAFEKRGICCSKGRSGGKQCRSQTMEKSEGLLMQWNHQGMELEFQPEMAWDHFHLFEDTPQPPEQTGMRTPLPEETPIGMAYVPYQQWDTTFSAEEGFPKGTIFPQLYKPFCSGGERHA